MKKIFLHLIVSAIMCFNVYATDFGTKEEAENMLERAVNILKLDKSLALELFAEGKGGFIYKDLYTLCYHISSGTMYSHPTLTGLSREKSVSEGVNIADLIVENAFEGKVNSINIRVPRFTTGDTKLFDKTLLVTKVENLACAVGFYKK